MLRQDGPVDSGSNSFRNEFAPGTQGLEGILIV